MVKFSKQFEGQLVPEWKEAFVDYWHLKKDLKKIHKNTNPPSTKPSLAQTLLLSPWRKLSLWCAHDNYKDHVLIQVHRKLASSGSNRADTYETELLEQLAGTDATKEFFARLDAQLNKVNQFYRAKEMEFEGKGESLKKQLQILVELKAALKQQRKNGSDGACSSSHGPKDDPSVSCSIASEEDSVKDPTGEQDQILLLQEKPTCDLDGCAAVDVTKAPNPEGTAGKLRSVSTNGRVFSCQGKSVKISIPLTTPSRTISALTDFVWDDLVYQYRKAGGPGGVGKVNVNKAKLHRAEKMIRGAFVELYKGLSYLGTYRNLNMLAFAKILKKFDKITGKQVLPIYLKVVESSFFNSSDKANPQPFHTLEQIDNAVKLMDEVEEIFIKHFADDDRAKAMKFLKPHQRRESDAVTFFIGLFTGCFIALFAGYCIMAHIAGMYTGHSDSIYMETVYPVLSMLSLLFLHLFLYGCNIFMWRKTRINYSFIFEFAPTKELKYRDVFLICTTSMALVVGVLFAHLSLIAKGHYSSEFQAIPGLLFLLFLLILVCPFNIAYRPTRYQFMKVIRNIILSPLYKVVMVDFFMADQLCSQVPMLRNLEYVACYYITGSYRTQDYGFCSRTSYYRDLAYAVSFLPYYWRAMQCARRWFDEGQTSHLTNLGKYVSAMLAAGAKVAYEKEKSLGCLSLLIALSSTATVYQLYWDFVKDWGLLQYNSKNRWLRNELILRRKFVYFSSMGINFVLRLAWLQTIIHTDLGNLDYRVTTFFLAALEVIRRGQWNFYRLENEHLNNAGKFRAVKTVPLPFHEVDED